MVTNFIAILISQEKVLHMSISNLKQYCLDQQPRSSGLHEPFNPICPRVSDHRSIFPYWTDQMSERSVGPWRNYHFLAYLSIHRHDKMYEQYLYWLSNNVDKVSNCNLKWSLSIFSPPIRNCADQIPEHSFWIKPWLDRHKRILIYRRAPWISDHLHWLHLNWNSSNIYSSTDHQWWPTGSFHCVNEHYSKTFDMHHMIHIINWHKNHSLLWLNSPIGIFSTAPCLLIPSYKIAHLSSIRDI